MSLALLVLLLVSQIGRWTKRAEEKTGLDSIRVRLESVFVSKELYESELSSVVDRLQRVERKLNGPRSDQHSHIE